MGLRVTTLHNVPVDNLDQFIYVLEPSYSHEYKEWFDANFDTVGKDLGRNAAIVRGYDERLTDELMQVILHYAVNCGQTEPLANILMKFVTLIITKGNILTTHEPIYAIPIAVMDGDLSARTQFMTILMKRILEAIHDGSIGDLVERLGYHTIELRHSRPGILFSTLRHLNDVMELKPNIAGFGLNINEILERLLEPRREVPDI